MTFCNWMGRLKEFFKKPECIYKILAGDLTPPSMLIIYTFLYSDSLSGVEACLVTSTYNCAIKSYKYVEPQHWDVS